MEQQQRQLLIKALNACGLDACSVENPAYPGTPDIQFIGGWIECKYLEEWPKREETTVRIEHYTPQQRAWIFRRAIACDKLETNVDRAHLVLYVAKKREWLLFDGRTAARTVAKDGVTRKDLLRIALVTTTEIKDIIDYVIIC